MRSCPHSFRRPDAPWRAPVLAALTAMALSLAPATHTLAQDEPAATDPQSVNPSALSLAEEWCDAIMTLDEFTAVSLMTPELQADVAMARAANDAFITLHPDEKPPLGDGLPLTSFLDAVSGCTIEAADMAGALITISSGSGGAQWQDRIEFAPGPGGGLMISDVLYAPDHQVRLSQALMMAAEPGE